LIRQQQRGEIMKNFSLPVKQFRKYFLNLSASPDSPTSPKTPVAAGEVRIIQIAPRGVKEYFAIGRLFLLDPLK
jgi:hypothetical protein